MRASVSVAIVVMTICFLVVGPALSADTAMRTETGKVIGVDAEGKGLTIQSRPETMKNWYVGVIIQPDTKITAGGKTITQADLSKEIKAGDTVTVKYVKSDDLYAKEIIKK